MGRPKRPQLKAEQLESTQDSMEQQMEYRPEGATSTVPLRGGTVPPAQTAPSASSSSATAGDLHTDVEMSEPTPSGLELLGHQSRQLILGIHKLEALNITSTLPSLPKFVMIGDQSAGKSSIIEAACDILLPRQEGTCTRCPFQITTTTSRNGAPWSCKISIQKRYIYVPEANGNENGATFDKWQELSDPVPEEFDIVYSKMELEAVLRRAQLAILNPQVHSAEFKHADVTRETDYTGQQVGFSPNVIVLNIEAPSLPELSFYDLPGAINTTSDPEEQYLVEFIERLLKSYIKEDKAFLILACAADQDLEVSTAFRFLRECRATQRSMGVLTKPDRLHEMTEGRINHLKTLLGGRKGWQVGDGWFVTRQFPQNELDREGLTYNDARNLEAAFFAAAPWSTSLVEHANQFGIPHLQTAISRKLTSHIVNELPHIVNRVEDRLRIVDQQLAGFPAQPTAPCAEVFLAINDVKTTVCDEMKADNSKSEFRVQYRAIFRDLRDQIRGLAPTPILSTPGHQKPVTTVDDSDAEDVDDTPSKCRKTNSSARFMSVTPSQSARRARRVPVTPSNDDTSRIVLRLDEIKARFDAASTADIPGSLSDGVSRDLMLEPVKNWSSAVEKAIKEVQTVCARMLSQLIEATLPKHQETLLLFRTKEIVNALLQELWESVSEIVRTLVAAETCRAISYNDKLMKSMTNSIEAELRTKRTQERTYEHFDNLETQGNKVPLKPEQTKRAAEAAWVATNLKADPYDREVKALVAPLAYYNIASSQLIDSIAKYYEHNLMSAYQDRLSRRLFEGLQADNAVYCSELLAEDPRRERERAVLEAEKEKLKKALDELKDLPMLRHV